MAEYIEREALIAAVQETHFTVTSNEHPYKAVEKQGAIFRRLVDEAPTADVVEVVRCCDCRKSRETEDEEVRFCMQFADTVHADAFCSYGERRGE